MADSAKPPTDASGPALDDNALLAYEATIEHHGHVINTFSSNFVNVFALFNAGGFSASLAILPTQLGTRILVDHPYVLKYIVSFFAAGFVTSSALMVVIFDYSLHKYWDYRRLLVSGKQFSEIPAGSHYKFAAWAWVLLAVSIGTTGLAIGFSLLMFYAL